MLHTFAVCSDTHGQPPPVFGPGVEVMLHAGDVYHGPGLPGGERFSPDLRRWMEEYRGRVLAVRGNHDYDDPAGFFERFEDVSGRVVKVAATLWVAGIGAAYPKWFDLPTEVELGGQAELVARQALRLVMPGEGIILLTHYPVSINPQRPAPWGYASLATLVRQLRPVAVVQGHDHERFGHVEWWEVEGQRVLAVFPGPGGGVLTLDDLTWTAEYNARPAV